MKSRLLSLAGLMVCLGAWSASAQTLSVGDNAPALEVSKWVKGDKIEKLEKDQTYVVEFWATWCGPCKTSIPHLTELQKKYKDQGVKVIGVSILEQDPALVEPFVKEMGGKMDYSVALDLVPKGEDADAGKMAKNWLTASDSQGIPTAFIVKGGKVAWIGHPMAMDKPLEKATSADFDLTKAISEAREEKAKEKKLMAVYEKLMKLGENASPKQQLEVLNKAIEDEPSLAESLGYQKYILMLEAGHPGASAFGIKLIDGPFKDDAEALNQIAWMNIDPEGTIEEAKSDPKLALKAALRASELTKNENGAILDTLALAYFKTGDPDKALETQEKALKFAEADDGTEDMKARLKMYQKAVSDKKKP